MKKIILFIALTLLLTGCSGKMTYEFTESKINSKATIKFNIEEYKKYQRANSDEYEDDKLFEGASADNLVKTTYDSSSIIATNKDNKMTYYTKSSFKKENNEYNLTYDYTFTYDDFKYNHQLKECFDTFTATSDDNYYYYNVKGKYKCGDESIYTLEVIAKNRIFKSNADKKDNDVHSWNIKKNDNDIYFVIAKNEIAKQGFKKTYIFVFLTIIVLSAASFFILKKANNNY